MQPALSPDPPDLADGRKSESEVPEASSSGSWDSDPQPLVVRRRISRNSSLSFSRESISSSVSHHNALTDLSYVREVERSNLTCLMKLIVKHLLETAMRKNRVVEPNEVPLVNFFVTFENIMSHGLRVRKNLLGTSTGRDFWPVLELVSRLKPEAVELSKSARDMPHVRTNAGRGRTWIRMAFVQKRLSDYFQALIDRKDLLTEFYEDDAFVMSEEAVAIGGLLIGLNVIECNEWYARDEKLDALINVVDLKHYLKSSSLMNESIDVGDVSDQTKELLDQKNYLEELNRKMTTTIANLKHKLSHAVPDKDNHFEILPDEPDSPAASIANGTCSIASNTPTPSETDELERMRREIESLNHAGNEMSVAMKLLEKDVHEKQDTIISIRRQLEDIKAINIQMFHKIKQYESDVKEKDSKIAKLDQKVASCVKTISQLESKIKSTEERKSVLEELKEQQEIQIKEKELKSTSIEKDLRQEREWRSSLKKLLDDQEAEVTRLSIELEEAKNNLGEYNRLRKEYLVLQKKCSEYELSLEEVGGQLKESKLEVDDLKESSFHLKEAFWMKDSDVSECFQCEGQFSLSKRKHHCRNCGRIFCNSCSDNKMPLASSEKPVRVCDSCHTILLERCAVK